MYAGCSLYIPTCNDIHTAYIKIHDNTYNYYNKFNNTDNLSAVESKCNCIHYFSFAKCCMHVIGVCMHVTGVCMQVCMHVIHACYLKVRTTCMSQACSMHVYEPV